MSDIQLPTDESEEEIVVPVPKVSLKGQKMKLTNQQMLESWLNHTVYVSIVGHGTVQAKIIGVDPTHTEIEIEKDTNK
jgi:hypothetical protein